MANFQQSIPPAGAGKRELVGHKECWCGEKTYLRRTMAGGMVKSVCPTCLKQFPISPKDFEDHEAFQLIKCDRCPSNLTPLIKDPGTSNYVLKCAQCKYRVELADLVPDA